MSIALIIQELGQPSPITVTLSGSLLPEIGIELPVEQKGGKYVAIGSQRALLAATGVDYGGTDMMIGCNAAFIREGHIQVDGTDVVYSPEGIAELFQTITKRGRLLAVSIGRDVREGVLRSCTKMPTRGYTKRPVIGGTQPDGVSCDLKLRFEWSGEVGLTPVDGGASSFPDASNGLAGGINGISSALNDPFAASFTDQIGSAAAKLRSSVSSLRGSLKQATDLVNAPADAANTILASARTVRNLAADFDDALTNIPDNYKSISGNANAVIGQKRATSAAQAGVNAIFAALSALFEALEKRSGRRVGVRPGQALSDIAGRELGDRNRWTEIAELNEFGGQAVPPGVFQVELP